MSKAQWIKENLNPGDIYAGLILGKNGDADYHLILLPAKTDSRMNWKDACAWAKKAGGALPTRREQSLLFANLKEEFEPAWYWSGEQHATYSDFAWSQDFGSGDQGDYHKSHYDRARAVRRVEVTE